jgi:PAS domain S-box-containing protein
MGDPEQGSASASQQVNDLFDALDVAHAIDSHEFRLFLDQLPIAIIVSKIVNGDQRIVFANKSYEELTGQNASDIKGRGWSVLASFTLEGQPDVSFTKALIDCDDFIGTFQREQPKHLLIDAFSSVIQNEDETEDYCIVALIDITERARSQREELERQLRDKDLLLKELQHRVKNNLQLIAALIRLDIRNQSTADRAALDRLAGRIESLAILYRELSGDGLGQTIDLGQYLTQIASAVTRTHGLDGIRLDLKADQAPISINVAMPIGLLVNEMMTNAFKYAFDGRDAGTLTVRCLQEHDGYYKVVVADDGSGLPEGATWPVPGKLSALMLATLRENAKAEVVVDSAPGKGMRVSIGLFRDITRAER